MGTINGPEPGLRTVIWLVVAVIAGAALVEIAVVAARAGF